MISKYILPYRYFFSSRLTRLDRKLSWVLIEPLPVFLLTYYFMNAPFWELSLLFLLGYTAHMSIYEAGYLENDSVSTINEASPVLRLFNGESAIVLKNLKKIEALRWLITALMLIMVYYLGKEFNIVTNLYNFFLLIVLIRVIYIIHNHFRNRSNIVTLFILSSSRYISMPCLFLDLQTITGLLIVLILIYPFPKTLEYASQTRYHLPFRTWVRQPYQALFRLIYYAILFSVTLLLFFFKAERNMNLSIAMSLFGYFLVYRFLILLLKLR